MAERTPRRVFESGHERKFLVVIDDTPEFRTALLFAARVAARTGGKLAMLHVLPTAKNLSSWMPMDVTTSLGENQLTQEVVQELRGWLKNKGIENLKTEAISRSGDKAEEILKHIQADEDVAVLVLGASADPAGPGPVVSSITQGGHAGEFPIPIYLVPGDLSFDEIAALA